MREATLKRHHLSVSAYKALLEEQGARCGICGRPFADAVLAVGTALMGLGRYTPDGKEMPVIDHDHACCPKNSCGRCVRGVLCHMCNMGGPLVKFDHYGVSLRYWVRHAREVVVDENGDEVPNAGDLGEVIRAATMWGALGPFWTSLYGGRVLTTEGRLAEHRARQLWLEEHRCHMERRPMGSRPSQAETDRVLAYIERYRARRQAEERQAAALLEKPPASRLADIESASQGGLF